MFYNDLCYSSISENEDYFPTDAWTTPHMELPPLPPEPKPANVKKKKKTIKKEFNDGNIITGLNLLQACIGLKIPQQDYHFFRMPLNTIPWAK